MSDTSVQIELYNTLTKSRAPFQPADATNVRMYVCGPTVYDYAHIGNARPAIVFDVLFRLLRHVYGHEHVTYVRNITDVDDKITNRARTEHPGLPLNEAIREVTARTETQYKNDMRALGCLDPTIEPRATEHIVEMAEMISTLVAKGHAYLATGAEGREVLFDVASMPEYGQLSRRNLDDQQAGARIAVKDHKRNPEDFVLWKKSAADEPGWPLSLNGETILGRPGWHIECSAMSEKYLGQTFDIHGGGLDLIFPHHENEIAQSRCAHGLPTMANVWMHNGFLQVEGEKMSKSLGNFFTVHQLLETEDFGGRKWPGDVLRLAILMTNYREPIDFSLARLNEAEEILSKWKDRIGALGLAFDGSMTDVINDAAPSEKLLDALASDLNMPGAIAEMHRLAKGSTREDAQHLFGALSLLGLADAKRMADWEEARRAAISSVDHLAIDQRVAERLAALNNKDWASADRIRDELAAEGILLKDSKDSATGERITTWELKS